MKIFRIRNFDELKVHVDRNTANYSIMQKYEAGVIPKNRKEFKVKGVSYPANQYVDFHVDYNYSDGQNINWRERLVCPVTNLNNRLRCTIHLIDTELSPYPDSNIYISEEVTPLFAYLKKKFDNIVGSEYLGDSLRPGETVNNIRHEDMTRMSFADDSFEYYLSFECFEHIPEYSKAVTEAYRILKPGGTFLGSFPFDRNRYENLIRAKIGPDGSVIHLMEPEYHGDPVNEQGILCFTVFGWEFLDEFRRAGFRDVYTILVWSDLFGYLGGEQIYFIAKK
ncbi:class I SAM-dependent methyltransferase [Puia sp. P3]|uniref:class I SAM-dependent methyltransferase n=1 Tax=Puia sp. P3 TaxID=3423952 RepID=UPI003D66FFA4